MTMLISFLGRSQLDSKGGYREASYRLPDGAVRSARYFGLALAQHLAAERGNQHVGFARRKRRRRYRQ